MTLPKPVVGILLAFALTRTENAAAATKLLRWSELEAAISNRPVTIVLGGGTRLTGTVAEVRLESLRMAVDRSSDSKTYPPGEISVDREHVAEIRIKEVKGPGRVIGAAGLGAGASLGTLGWAISDSRVNVSDGARIAQWSAITATAVVGGYLIGRHWDTTTTVIRVVKAD